MKHGTTYSYRVMRCPCDECREAHRQAMAKWRAANHARRVLIDGRWVYPAPPERHGCASFYCVYGCRCAACTEAERRGQVASKQQRKAQLKAIAELGLLDS